MTRKEKKAATEARIDKESLELAENIFKWSNDYQRKGEKDPFGKALKLVEIKFQKDTKANPSETHIYKRIADRAGFLIAETVKQLVREGSVKIEGGSDGKDI